MRVPKDSARAPGPCLLRETYRSCKDTPWQAAENLPRQQGLDVLSKEGHKDKGSEDAKGPKNGPLLAEMVHQPAVQDGAKERTDTSAVAHPCLPCWLELVARPGTVSDPNPPAVLLLELGKGIELILSELLDT